ncbi:polysaccharide biosynthesis tyrosine autokinase [Flavobacteriaceae bacterium]|nr:polysaccharide biosynthesis tyrosine autokinase [Flavobacteriaceae bacterium]
MNKQFQNQEQQDELDLKKEFLYYSFFWPYFLLSIVIALLGAFLYLRYTPKIYTASGQIQFQKSDADPTAFLAENAGSLFDFDKVNLDNEIALINSYRILSQVVENKGLNYVTRGRGQVKSTLMYGSEIPFQLAFNDSIASSPKFGLIEVNNGIAEVRFEETRVTLKPDEPLSINGWTIAAQPEIIEEDRIYEFSIRSTQSAVNDIKASLNAAASAKASEVVDLGFEGENTTLNTAVIDEIIRVLEKDQVSEKQRISEVSISFIESRLNSLITSIDTISKETSQFRVSNYVFDPLQQTSNTLTRIEKSKSEIVNLGIQKEIASSILNTLTDDSIKLLPFNVGIEDSFLNSTIAEYNRGVLERDVMLVSATEQSPMVMQLNRQLSDKKQIIIDGLKKYISNIDLSLNSFRRLENEARQLVSGLPAKETKLTELLLNSSILQELYVFLLQRKEEASLAYVSALPTLKVLSPALSKSTPIKPVSLRVYALAFSVGLSLPLGILILLRILDTKINTRDDLENGLKGNTIVGEIPLEKDETKIDSPRGTIAEATRVMRSNLAFMLPDDRPIVITSTSSVKGEGKSFVSFNIARSYAALSKKVLLIGADLRNPQLHNRLKVERAGIGLSTFLSKPNDTNFKDLITLRENDNVHYLLSGAIPPNPSELLARPAMKTLLDQLKEHYDLIIIDSAPLMLVSDTSPILPLSDLVLYVSRAQVTDKNVFPFIKDLQKRKNMPPLALVLNGIIAGPASYYKYGYAYRYSYNYKYNYGYGYGYGSGDKGDA